VLVFTAASLALASSAGGQSAVERSPNVTGDWPGSPGMLYFHFLHRFTNGAPPARKVTSSPTFLVATALPRRTMLGVHYATNSDVAPRYPNEWEVFGRWAPLAQSRGAPLDAGAQAGYNVAARSLDSELSLGRGMGPLRVQLAGRLLSRAFETGEAGGVLAAGGVLRLGRYVALAADAASAVDRPAGYRAAWSAGLQLAIPYSPHTLSLHATNANTGTLQGSSASRDGRRRYGFEFTIPIPVRRYLRRGAPVARQDSTPSRTEMRVVMRDDLYLPARIEISAGTAIVWVNDDARPHTVTASDGSWDSGYIEPGESWRRVFDQPGTYPITCSPHPQMRAVVVVR
jgi:plastocyanin